MPGTRQGEAVTKVALGPFPDRPLEPDTELATVAIRGAGHRMSIFKKMVQGPGGGLRPRDGDLVRVVDGSGAQVGYGLWNSQSQVAIRVVSRLEQPPGAAYWEEKLARAVALRREGLKLDATTDAYRVIHAEGDGLSGLVVDRFGDVLSVEVFSLGMYQRAGSMLGPLHAFLGTRHARLRMDAAIGRAEGFHPRALDSEQMPAAVVVTEHGIRYRIRFEVGHKTGFFCDQRDNRLGVREFSGGRKVLDLCCYTGGFGLNALLKGDAVEVTCVDLDENALAMARENANLNQVKPRLVHSDAFGYARQMIANGNRYGLVILDPPKLISSREELVGGRYKYGDLNSLAMQLVEEGGYLVTCSCSGLLGRDEFLHLLRTSAWRAGRTAQVLKVTGASADHPVRLDAPESEYLKVAWLKIGAGEGVGGSDTEDE